MRIKVNDRYSISEVLGYPPCPKTVEYIEQHNKSERAKMSQETIDKLEELKQLRDAQECRKRVYVH